MAFEGTGTTHPHIQIAFCQQICSRPASIFDLGCFKCLTDKDQRSTAPCSTEDQCTRGHSMLAEHYPSFSRPSEH